MSNNISLIFTTDPTNSRLLRSDCGALYGDNLVLILWMVATFCVFLGLVSTIYTIFLAYQLYSVADEYEKSIIDLIDEGLQILLPTGICKQICHPTIGATNFQLKNQSTQVLKKRQKENRYPDDVTYPPSDIELFYDFFGDEDVRVPRTISLMAEKSSDDADVVVPPAIPHPSAEKVSKEKVVEPKPTKNVNPFRSLFSNRKNGYKKLKEPEPLSTPVSTPGKLTPSKEVVVDEVNAPLIQPAPKVLNRSRELLAEEKTQVTGPSPAKQPIAIKNNEVIGQEDPQLSNKKPNTVIKLSKESVDEPKKINTPVKPKSSPYSPLPKPVNRSREYSEDSSAPNLKTSTPTPQQPAKNMSKETANDQKTNENIDS